MELGSGETGRPGSSVLSKILAILAIVLAGAGATLFIVALSQYGWRDYEGPPYDEWIQTKIYVQFPLIGYVDPFLVGMLIACAIIVAGGVAFALSRRLR